MSIPGASSSAMTSDASTRSSAGSGRPVISRKRCRAKAGCVRTRPVCCISSLRHLLKHSHLLPQFVCDGGLTVLVPIEQHDHNSSSCSKLPAAVRPDLVQSVEGSCPDVTDSYTNFDRLHFELVTKITLGAGHDEADVFRARAARQCEPHARAREFEVGEIDGVVDVAESIDVAEDDLPRNHVPTTLPARLTHDLL